MDKIKKGLAKLSPKEKEWVKDLLQKIAAGNIKELNLKKLKGRNDIFRVRKGDIRIIYRADASGKIFVLAIERKSEKIYKF